MEGARDWGEYKESKGALRILDLVEKAGDEAKRMRSGLEKFERGEYE